MLSRATVFAAIAMIAACRSRGVRAPSPAPLPSALACPAKLEATKDWPTVDDSARFTIALPPGFEERQPSGAFRHFEMAGDFQESISIGIIRGDLGMSGYKRPYQQELMPEYSECSEVIGGIAASIQAWRTPNGVFRNFQRLDRYDVFAIWEIRPGAFLYFSGGTYRRPTQDLMLASIRSRQRGRAR